MITVTIGNNLNKEKFIMDEARTVRSALEEAGVDYSASMTMLDGASLRPGDMDKSFADFGIYEQCKLISVVKADSAA